MKTLYVVKSEGLEDFVAWGEDGIEKALRDLFDAQIVSAVHLPNGYKTIKALDAYGFLPELTAEPHTEIYGVQKDD